MLYSFFFKKDNIFNFSHFNHNLHYSHQLKVSLDRFICLIYFIFWCKVFKMCFFINNCYRNTNYIFSFKWTIAADFFIIPIDWIIIGSISISPILKYYFDLSVDAPQYLSTGTFMDPILSYSLLVFIIICLSILIYFLYIMLKKNQIGVIWQILKKSVYLWKHLVKK